METKLKKGFLPKVVTTQKCENCGKEFSRRWTPGQNPPPLYCSQKCSRKAWMEEGKRLFGK